MGEYRSQLRRPSGALPWLRAFVGVAPSEGSAPIFGEWPTVTLQEVCEDSRQCGAQEHLRWFLFLDVDGSHVLCNAMQCIIIITGALGATHWFIWPEHALDSFQEWLLYTWRACNERCPSVVTSSNPRPHK